MTDEEINYYLLEVEKGNKRYGIYLKNHIEDLAKERNKLYKQLQQKENIIKEVREYIETLFIEDYDGNSYYIRDKNKKELGIEGIGENILEILDKENKYEDD